MTRKRGRLVKASVALGAAGAGVALTAGPAAAAVGSLQATPTKNLHNGQSVSVYWDTGAFWGSTIGPSGAMECYQPLPAGTVTEFDLGACASLPAALQAVEAADGDVSFQGNVTVEKAFIASDGSAVTCSNQCSIVVLEGTLAATSSGSVPITFK
jgi:hypothetical protein